MFAITCNAILFDLDGTLVDSAERIRRLWGAWSQGHRIDLESILTVMSGRRAVETIQLVAPHLQADREAAALEADEVADMAGVQAYAGAAGLLSQLSSRQWAIVTSGSKRVAEARLTHVDLPIPAVLITAENVGSGKPAPDGYLLAAHRLGRQPAECLVIEDAPAGILAGKAAGMHVVAVTTTHPAEALQRADAIVPQLANLTFELAGAEIHVRGDF